MDWLALLTAFGGGGAFGTGALILWRMYAEHQQTERVRLQGETTEHVARIEAEAATAPTQLQELWTMVRAQGAKLDAQGEEIHALKVENATLRADLAKALSDLRMLVDAELKPAPVHGNLRLVPRTQHNRTTADRPVVEDPPTPTRAATR